MKKITITVQDGDVKRTLVLREPGFDELKMAFIAMQAGKTKTGDPDIVGAGKVIIDTCKIEAESDKLFFSTSGGKLMFAAALKAAGEVEFFEADLKKN